MKRSNITKKIADIIQDETAYFNGWSVLRDRRKAILRESRQEDSTVS